MLHLKNKPLPKHAQDHLNTLQKEIDSISTGVKDQAIKASKLWDNKAPKEFDVIHKTLFSMAIGEGICNYCEQSEGHDTEHIQPKSHFPSQAFNWENYLLACPKCNRVDKLDKAYAFSPAGSNTSVKLKRGQLPPSQDFAMIQPRLEDPMNIMLLDLDTFEFKVNAEKVDFDSRDFHKVENTLEILRLNNRSTLVKNRKTAFGNFKRLLKEYAGVKESTDFEQINEVTEGSPALQQQKGFETEKSRVLQSLKEAVLTSEHLTVWYEMLRQRHKLPPRIQNLLSKAPETLSW